ncbi:hypothetical protein ILUMI_02970 [Ignelater luminosus]|uniref:HTH psq-type domain-containing protein n=1 Tax=Ignelater luminosus TaxID=2038154 RepID=A0A8K0DH86_IGNLU|nr:hypothetical protein ILUMI_02970 [Ignelater luminosus]
MLLLVYRKVEQNAAVAARLYAERFPERIAPCLQQFVDAVHALQLRRGRNDPEDEDDIATEPDAGPSASKAFASLNTASKWVERQPECNHLQLLTVKRIRDLTAQMHSPDTKTTDIWSQEDLIAVMDGMRQGMPPFRASRLFNIPRHTLRNHLASGSLKTSLGHGSVLSDAQEAEHLEIAKRRAQKLKPARAQKTNCAILVVVVDDYFTKLETVLTEKSFQEKPSQIYNMNKKGCQLALHHQQTVLAHKGTSCCTRAWDIRIVEAAEQHDIKSTFARSVLDEILENAHENNAQVSNKTSDEPVAGPNGLNSQRRNLKVERRY